MEDEFWEDYFEGEHTKFDSEHDAAMLLADAIVEDSLTAKCGHWVECTEICDECNRCADCCLCEFKPGAIVIDERRKMEEVVVEVVFAPGGKPCIKTDWHGHTKWTYPECCTVKRREDEVL